MTEKKAEKRRKWKRKWKRKSRQNGHSRQVCSKPLTFVEAYLAVTLNFSLPKAQKTVFLDVNTVWVTLFWSPHPECHVFFEWPLKWSPKILCSVKRMSKNRKLNLNKGYNWLGFQMKLSYFKKFVVFINEIANYNIQMIQIGLLVFNRTTMLEK